MMLVFLSLQDNFWSMYYFLIAISITTDATIPNVQRIYDDTCFKFVQSIEYLKELEIYTFYISKRLILSTYNVMWYEVAYIPVNDDKLKKNWKDYPVLNLS